MERSVRDAVLRRKILGKIADIEAFIAGMREADFYHSKVARKP